MQDNEWTKRRKLLKLIDVAWPGMTIEKIEDFLKKTIEYIGHNRGRRMESITGASRVQECNISIDNFLNHYTDNGKDFEVEYSFPKMTEDYIKERESHYH